MDATWKMDTIRRLEITTLSLPVQNRGLQHYSFHFKYCHVEIENQITKYATKCTLILCISHFKVAKFQSL